MKIVTLQQLKDYKACDRQVELFEKYFGNSVVLTKRIIKKYCSKFDIDWLANEVLSDPLWKQYEDAVAPLRKQYEDAVAPLWKQYLEAKALTFFELYESKE